MADSIAKALVAFRGLTVPGSSLSAADVFALLGALVVGASFLNAVLSALGSALRCATPRRRLTSYGSWAVVTGATDVRASS